MELLASIFNLSLNSLLTFTAISLFVWYYVWDKLTYWQRRGVPEISPWKSTKLFLSQMCLRKTMYGVVREQYDALEGQSFGGTFVFFKPDAIILRDPAMVKEWLVKGFSSFHDRIPPPDDEDGKNLSGNLFSLTGDRWHTVRTKLSVGFSSAKLKVMYETLADGAQELNGYLQELCGKKGEVEIDMRDLVSRYAMDVIGACTMGIKCNAIKDPDNCEMKKAVSSIFRLTFRMSLQGLLGLIHPKLKKLVRFLPGANDLPNFLTSVTKDAMELKTKSGQTRKDFLQIMMNASNSEVENAKGLAQRQNGLEKKAENEGFVFTENIIAGVISTFLSAGLEPVSATVTFCLHELAFQPEIQDRLFEEIQAVKNESGGEIRFEELKKLEYLEQVVNETLRKFPVAGILFRVCTEPFQIPDSSIVVEKGIKLMIPTYSIQHDPKYFPDPEKFDPERFSKENIDKIVPGSYTPFGEGPRFCIANRLALMDVKTMLMTLVSDYTVHPCARTRNQLQFDPLSFTLTPKGAVWLKLKKRS